MSSSRGGRGAGPQPDPEGDGGGHRQHERRHDQDELQEHAPDLLASPLVDEAQEARAVVSTINRNSGTHQPESTGQASTGSAQASPAAFCQHPFLAEPCPAGRRLDVSVPTSWGDVVRSRSLSCGMWGPHSLHTTEVTGSIPVTPTSHRRRSAAHTIGRRRLPGRRQAANRRRAHSARPARGRGCRPEDVGNLGSGATAASPPALAHEVVDHQGRASPLGLSGEPLPPGGSIAALAGRAPTFPHGAIPT
jgi:hypothetical protein